MKAGDNCEVCLVVCDLLLLVPLPCISPRETDENRYIILSSFSLLTIPCLAKKVYSTTLNGCIDLRIWYPDILLLLNDV